MRNAQHFYLSLLIAVIAQLLSGVISDCPPTLRHATALTRDSTLLTLGGDSSTNLVVLVHSDTLVSMLLNGSDWQSPVNLPYSGFTLSPTLHASLVINRLQTEFLLAWDCDGTATCFAKYQVQGGWNPSFVKQEGITGVQLAPSTDTFEGIASTSTNFELFEFDTVYQSGTSLPSSVSSSSVAVAAVGDRLVALYSSGSTLNFYSRPLIGSSGTIVSTQVDAYFTSSFISLAEVNADEAYFVLGDPKKTTMLVGKIAASTAESQTIDLLPEKFLEAPRIAVTTSGHTILVWRGPGSQSIPELQMRVYHSDAEQSASAWKSLDANQIFLSPMMVLTTSSTKVVNSYSLDMQTLAYQCSPACQNFGRCCGPNTCDCTDTSFTGDACEMPVISSVFQDPINIQPPSFVEGLKLYMFASSSNFTLMRSADMAANFTQAEIFRYRDRSELWLIAADDSPFAFQAEDPQTMYDNSLVVAVPPQKFHPDLLWAMAKIVADQPGKRGWMVQYNSWGVHPPVCNEPESPWKCPDIILAGTTITANWVSQVNVSTMEGFFAHYAFKTGSIFSDLIAKRSFQNLIVDGIFYAIPYSSDVRLMAFNKNFFDNNNLPYPPPYVNPNADRVISREEWTWDHFIDFTEEIYNKTGNPGWNWSGRWALFWGMSILQDQGGVLWRPDDPERTCQLRNSDKFKGVIQNIVDKAKRGAIHVNTASSRSTDPITDLANYIEATASDPESWWTVKSFCCGNPIGNQSTMFIVSSEEHVNRFINEGRYFSDDPRDANNPIGVGYFPGDFTFLGGSVLLQYSNNRENQVAHEYLYQWFQLYQQTPQLGPSPGPYDSVFRHPYWSQPRWKVTINSISQNSAPPQYPLSIFPALSDLDTNLFFNPMLLQTIFNNMTVDQGVEWSCQTLEYLILPGCSNEHWIASMLDSLSRNVSFTWSSTERLCRGGFTLPNITDSFDCDYVPYNSGWFIAWACIACFGIVFILISSITMVVKRNEKFIRRSSPTYSGVFALGCVLLIASTFFFGGPATITNCLMRMIFCSIGLTLFFGAFLVKLYRIDRIFNTMSLTTNVRLTDKKLALYLVIVLLLDFVLIIIWATVNNSYLEENNRVVILAVVDPTPVNVTTTTCSVGYMAIFSIIIGYKGLLALATAVISWRIRSAPSELNEQKLVLISTAIIGLIGLIILVINFLDISGIAPTIVTAVGLTLTSLIAYSVFALPFLLKLLGLGVTKIVLSQPGSNTNSTTNTRGSAKNSSGASANTDNR